MDIVHLTMSSGNYGQFFGRLAQRRILNRLRDCDLSSLKEEQGITNIAFSPGEVNGNYSILFGTSGQVIVDIDYSSPIKLTNIEDFLISFEKNTGVDLKLRNETTYLYSKISARTNSAHLSNEWLVLKNFDAGPDVKVYSVAYTDDFFRTPESVFGQNGKVSEEKKFLITTMSDVYDESQILEHMDRVKQFRDEKYPGMDVTFKIQVKRKLADNFTLYRAVYSTGL